MTTVGVVGAGQLGQMLALAGLPLGVDFLFYDPKPDSPAAKVGKLVVGEFDDTIALSQFAHCVDVITFEFENIPHQSLSLLQTLKPVFPPESALQVSQDRLLEKQLFNQLGIPTNRFFAIYSQKDLEAAVQSLGVPCVIKTTRLGYDGKGQVVLREPNQIESVWQQLGPSVPLIAEEFVAFDREVSLIAVRSQQGELAHYPLIINEHRGGILYKSQVGFSVDAEIQALALKAVYALMDHFNYVGVFTVEFFQKGDMLLANEMAPRVHNSGHWSIEGAMTSQFENHLRAILDWPLGSCDLVSPCALLNLIGTIPSPEEYFKIPGAHLHVYGKAPAPNRKLGHVTFMAPSLQELKKRFPLGPF